jgi:hypothetical protein
MHAMWRQEKRKKDRDAKQKQKQTQQIYKLHRFQNETPSLCFFVYESAMQLLLSIRGKTTTLCVRNYIAAPKLD